MSLLEEKIRKLTVQGLADYNMLEDGDRLMVAVSGGKDSSILLKLLGDIQKKASFKFDIFPVILDQKQPGFDVEKYKNWVTSIGFDLTVLEHDTHSIVKEKVPEGKTFCGLCSRLRRGILYNHAFESGYNKIALGHHRDDLNETLLMNLFYSGSIKSMPPKLISDDKRNIVIRPMCYVPEKMLIELAPTFNIPIIPCNLCGSQDGLKRQKIKGMIRDLEKETSDIGSILLNAQKNIRPSQLSDKNHWNF